MIGPWDVAAIMTAAALILYALHECRRPATAWTTADRAPAPVKPADDCPTAPIPVERETRVMLRRDELLWCKSDPDDPEGVITLGLLAEAGGTLGVLVDDNGIALGLRLDRTEVQGLRDAITNHLVATSRPVRP